MLPCKTIFSSQQGSDSASTPEPSTSGGILQNNTGQPPSSVTEDGYLGDCSSDGGNEKNFPMPPDTLRRLATTACSCHPPEDVFPTPFPPPPLSSIDVTNRPLRDAAMNDEDDNEIEPPAGLAFSSVQPEMLAASCVGYQVLLNRNEFEPFPVSSSSAASSSRKMRSSLKSRFVHHHTGTW